MSDEDGCDCKRSECDCGSGDCSCSVHGCSCGCGCQCGHGDHFQRRFQTKAEQTAALEAYLAELKLEVQAVEEKLADLKK